MGGTRRQHPIERSVVPEQRKGCNVPIVDGSTAGWEQILLEHKDEPVIVQGLFDPPPELTHRDQLLREFVSHPRHSLCLRPRI